MPVVRHVLPDDLSGLAEQRILFYEHSSSPNALLDEELLRKMRNCNLWAGVTYVLRCDTSGQLESWWKSWSARFAKGVNLREDHNYGIREYSPPFHLRWDEISAFYSNHVFSDSVGFNRWEMAYRGLEIDPALTLRCDELNSNLVDRRVGNWSTSTTGEDGTIIPIFTMVFVTALYGGLHALCWESHFPSYAEKMLWWTSSCIVVGGPATLSVLGLIFYVSSDIIA